MRPAGMLRRRVKLDVTDIDSGSQWHAEGLDSAVEVHVKKSVFIVPHAATQVGDFVTHKPDTIVARIRPGLVTVASVQALMAGCIRTVLAVGEKVKVLGPPLIENGR